jgi:hypothetical protein
MTQLIHDPFLTVFSATAPVRRPRTGVAFVPCELCLAPVDLALTGDAHGAHLCETHRVPDFAPLS